MGRNLLILGGATLFLVLLLSYAAFSLHQTEQEVLAAAEAEGRALLHAVSAAVQRSLEASPEVERLLADHLLQLAGELGEDLAAHPGQEERLLNRFVSIHHLKGALLLDGDLRARVTVGPDRLRPPGSARPSPGTGPEHLEPIVVADLVRRLRERGLLEKHRVVAGFGESPFGTRVEFLVARRIDALGGFLALRYDAERLRAFRGRAGVEPLLADAADSRAISYLLLQSEDGEVLAASDPSRRGEVLPPPVPVESWSEGEALDVSIPARWEGAPPGTLRVGLLPDPVLAVLGRARRSVLLFTGLCVLLGAGGMVGLALVDRVRRRREAELQAELFARERTSSMGRLAAGVAHEIRSPLNAIGMAAQRLVRLADADSPDPSGFGTIAGSIRKEVTRLNRTVEDFLELGRSRPLEMAPVDLGALVREVAAAEDPEAGIRPPPEAVPLRADGEELRKALANLVRNARQAAGEAPVVVAWSGDGAAVRIEVRDGGPGIPAEEREQVFEHFFSRRPGGTGLGLAIARSVALRHGGDLRLSEAPEGGACFTLTLPVAEAE